MADAIPWTARLRGCEAVHKAAAVLAEALGTLSGAHDCGVFLLNADGEQLAPVAVWPKGRNTPLHAQASIPVALEGDPLTFALQTGKAWCGTPGFPIPLSVRSISANPSAIGGIAAIPLLALGGRCGGGVLLGFIHTPPGQEALPTSVSDFGAVVLDALMSRERDSSLLDSLHDDLQRIAKKTYAESVIAKGIIGNSAVMRQARECIAQVALHDVPVLITGETGTGKELAAAAIHAASPRREKPFIKVNCGALPAQLMESELFGHKKGAFSGADTDQPGLFRSADGGTLLLDEVGEMPAELQVKLLRVLQDREVRPVGEVTSFPVDVHILAATNRNMEEALSTGIFRRDLYHRLAVVHIHMPPLRGHKEDIPELIQHFLREEAPEVARAFMRPETMASLLADSYPGNVRELAARVSGLCISREFMQRPLRTDKEQGFLHSAMAAYESAIVTTAMREWAGNTSDAAKALGLPRSTLRSKLQKLGISTGT